MDLFENQFNYEVGYVGRTAYENSTFLSEGSLENDVYHFSLSEVGNLDVSLHNLSHGDDADLQLYYDTNGNSHLDAHDELLDGSYNLGDADDSIRYDHAAAGDYFTRVSYFDGGYDGVVDYDLSIVSEEHIAEDYFEYSFNYDLGNIDRSTVERSTYLSEGLYENDIYQFSISEVSNLDFSLSSLDAEDDADLQLYHDTNHDGVLNAEDELLDGSYEVAGLEDAIDYDQAAAGTYFARVSYFNGGADTYVDYDLSLSAETYTHVNNHNRFDYQSNLYLGTVGRTPVETSLYLEQGVYENDSYELTLEEAGDLNVSLYNLSYGDDADLSLFRDVNNNYILDAHDLFIDDSVNLGDVDDSIHYEDAAAGTYFALVSYYDGGHDGLIDYTLSASAEADSVHDGGTTTGHVLVGDAGNNTLNGTGYNDTITGGAGDDVITGGAGDDVITGSNPDVLHSGAGEYDVVTGGAGADVFVLGDSVEAYYQSHGYHDYVSITDFDWTQGDKFQVHGAAEDYHLSEYNGGTDIYYQGELIGYVENTTDVLVHADFSFV